MKARHCRSLIKSLQATAFVAIFFAIGNPSATAADFGEPGEPIHLVVGHPCCYTQVWSSMVLRGKELWKEYLPEGSTIDWVTGLQGSTITTNMLAGKAQIGYVGDLPAIAAVSKRRIGELSMVAATGVSYDQCNILLVNDDAPKFKNVTEAIKWLGGKQFAVPKGTCSDIFSKTIFEKVGVQPATYLNQNVEIITSGFRADKLDGAAIWEPIAARLIDKGLARRVASGINYGLKDSSYMLMSTELIKQRPDVAMGWLNAELDAQLYMADESNAMEVIQMVTTQTTGFSEKALWDALYRKYPKEAGGTEVRITFPFTFTPTVMDLISGGAEFLASINALRGSELPPDAIIQDLADKVLEERGLKPPVGKVTALPESAYKGE